MKNKKLEKFDKKMNTEHDTYNLIENTHETQSIMHYEDGATGATCAASTACWNIGSL